MHPTLGGSTAWCIRFQRGPVCRPRMCTSFKRVKQAPDTHHDIRFCIFNQPAAAVHFSQDEWKIKYVLFMVSNPRRGRLTSAPAPHKSAGRKTEIQNWRHTLPRWTLGPANTAASHVRFVRSTRAGKRGKGAAATREAKQQPPFDLPFDTHTPNPTLKDCC